MAAERQLPGGAYINETGTRQAQVPGCRFVNETVSAGGATYTLVAGAGAFTLSGVATGLLAGRVMLAAAGAYALSGNTAGIIAGRNILANTSAYVVTGTAAGLVSGRVITGTAQAYSFVGNAAGLVYTPAGGATYTLVAGTGAFALSGIAVNFPVNRVMQAGVGAFDLSGPEAALSKRVEDDLVVLGGGAKESFGYNRPQKKKKTYDDIIDSIFNENQTKQSDDEIREKIANNRELRLSFGKAYHSAPSSLADPIDIQKFEQIVREEILRLEDARGINRNKAIMAELDDEEVILFLLN